MSTIALLNVAAWTPEKVVSWIKGLDSSVAGYSELFAAASIAGAGLLTLTNDDLDLLGIHKVGHQELLLQSVILLQSLNFELERETLCSIALDVSCRTRNLNNELNALASRALSAANKCSAHNTPKQQYLSILSAVSFAVSSIKTLTAFIDRIPFESNADPYEETRNNLVSYGLKLLELTHDETVLSDASRQESVMSVCRQISETCNFIITDSVDPLVIQPSSLELVRFHKKPEDDVGIDIKVSCLGVHTIVRLTPGSNASLCKKIEEGDEVIYVNGHTIVGWEERNMVAAFKENLKDVTMILKKRPSHVTITGGFQRKQKPRKELPKLNIGPKLHRSYGKKSRQSSADSVVSVPDGNLSDNDVFNSTTSSPSALHAIGLDIKARRATVSGASPTFLRAALSDNDLSSCIGNIKERPKSYFPRPTGRGRIPDWRPVTPDIYHLRTSAVLDELNAVPSQESLIGSDSASHKSETSNQLPANGVTSPPPAGNIPVSAITSRKHSPPFNALSPAAVGSLPAGKSTHTFATVPTNLHTPSAAAVPNNVPTPSAAPTSHLATSSPISHSTQFVAPSWKQGVGSTASTEIGDWGDRAVASPQLVGLSRIDSQKRAEMSFQERKPSIESLELDRPPPAIAHAVSVTSQKSKESSSDQTSISLLRKKNFLHKVIGVNRRISCKDLGSGDCQGWLWKKRNGNGLRAGRWAKFWFVLHSKNLYYYKDPEDLSAQGVIHLTGFSVSPAESRSKKFAFKVCKAETTFFFASERQDDMAKWMNKISLATLPNFSPQTSHRTAGYTKSSDKEAYYSESEDELLSPPTEVSSPLNVRRQRSPLPSTSSTVEDLTDLYRRIRQADLNVSGQSFKKKRTSLLQTTVLCAQDKHVEKYNRLVCLRRTLKDREQKLEIVEGLLSSTLVNSGKLCSFCHHHPNLLPNFKLPRGITPMDEDNGDSSSTDSDSEMHNQ